MPASNRLQLVPTVSPGSTLDGRPESVRWSRHTFLRVGSAAALSLLIAACGGRIAAEPLGTPEPALPADQETSTATGAPAVPVSEGPPPTATSAADAEALSLTPAQTEGPYFKPSSPERTSLVDPGMPGTRLVLTGRVLALTGQPIAHALLDFWQADATGAYDNSGYRLRGHQFTDEAGQYRLETVIPGFYPGRTRHIHVKVQPPNGPVLTTQLYFPDEARNASDGIFDPRLVLPIQDTPDGKTAVFDFVIQMA